jgi:hypothetical protein
MSGLLILLQHLVLSGMLAGRKLDIQLLAGSIKLKDCFSSSKGKKERNWQSEREEERDHFVSVALVLQQYVI